jgi:tetratricopeptide (TPR) repeat protein
VGALASLCRSETLEEAKRAFDSRNYALAAQLFEKSQADSPRCDTLFFIGLARYRLTQIDAALIAFQSAVECDPKLVDAHLALAEAYGVRGNQTQSLNSLERVLRLEPKNAVALRHASTLYLRNELNDKAIPLLEKLVEVDAGDVQAHVDLAVAYAATGNRPAAERQYREVLRLKPDSASAFTGLGNLALKAGEDEAGIELLNKAVAAAPDAFEPRFLLGSAYNRLGRYKEAATELEAVIRLGGEGADVYYHLARAYGGLDRADDRRKALARFSELTQRSKDDTEAQRKALRLIESSRTLLAAGDLNGAAAQLEEARRLRPADDGVLYRLASLNFDMRRNDLAKAYVEEAISHAPSQWLYHYLLGMIESNSARWPKARASLETAIRLNPSAAEAHNALGNAALQLHDRKLAIASFERAVELSPNEPAYRLNLDAARGTSGR